MCRASDKCQKEKRKTINGDDLLWAMATLGFEDYIEPLKVYLARYREVITKTFLFFVFLVNFSFSLLLLFDGFDLNCWRETVYRIKLLIIGLMFISFINNQAFELGLRI